MLALALLSWSLAAGEAKVTLEAPTFHVSGAPFRVRLVLTAPSDGAELEGWRLTPAGFRVNRQPLGAPSALAPLVLAGGEERTVEVDLGPELAVEADFQLAWGEGPANTVFALEPAPKGTRFLDAAAVTPAELARHRVLLRTSQGEILLELWPDAAPNHVRNFLELAATRFYADIPFHRVLAGVLIQGGDPDGTGSGRGPRQVAAEFNARKHERGVLSAARRGTSGLPGPEDPLKDTASSQFFILLASDPSLDGNYTAFGRVMVGMDTVERIAAMPTDGQGRPLTPQVIEDVFVVRAPAAEASR